MNTMIFTNAKSGHVAEVEPTPPCCARAVVKQLLAAGYEPFNPNARAYCKRLELHAISQGQAS